MFTGEMKEYIPFIISQYVSDIHPKHIMQDMVQYIRTTTKPNTKRSTYKDVPCNTITKAVSWMTCTNKTSVGLHTLQCDQFVSFICP